MSIESLSFRGFGWSHSFYRVLVRIPPEDMPWRRSILGMRRLFFSARSFGSRSP